ncbi:hypothetical protein JL722_2531 [Aureococcus anophagefferens]|nr:hypothetical protein JL722_2531 [Aureococcus anophagefferens]
MFVAPRQKPTWSECRPWRDVRVRRCGSCGLRLLQRLDPAPVVCATLLVVEVPESVVLEELLESLECRDTWVGGLERLRDRAPGQRATRCSSTSRTRTLAACGAALAAATVRVGDASAPCRVLAVDASRFEAFGDEEKLAAERYESCPRGDRRSVWACLVCGTLGCGRYAREHAKGHYAATRHGFALELETGRIWDYVEDRYAHRVDDDDVAASGAPCGGCGPAAPADRKFGALADHYERILEAQLASSGPTTSGSPPRTRPGRGARGDGEARRRRRRRAAAARRRQGRRRRADGAAARTGEPLRDADFAPPRQLADEAADGGTLLVAVDDTPPNRGKKKGRRRG